MANLATAQLSSGRERGPCAVHLESLTMDDEEAALRAEDFLNDKLQSQADFSSFDALIANVESQRAQLHAQLRAAQSKLETAQRQSAEHALLLLQQTEEFGIQQISIDERLSMVSSANAPDDAVEAFRSPMEGLRKLELAHLYMGLLQKVEDLSKTARSHLPAEPKQALIPYVQLREMSKAMLALQQATGGAAPHLVAFVDTKSSLLWEEMRNIMSSQLRSILKRMGYPAKALEPSEEFVDCFDKMLDLQEPELISASEPIALLPFAVLVEEFRERFRYHFMGDGDTNTKNNPEGAFAWTLDLFSNRLENMRATVTPLLVAKFRNSNFANNSVYIDAVSALITAFLPAIREKSEQFLSRTVNEPQYMSKYIQELIRFDTAVREQLKYDGGNIRNGWAGVTQEVLSKWFDTWMAAEKQFALNRYQEIIKSPANSSIDHDSSLAGKTKSTFGASMIMDLLTSVTLLYQPLRSFSYKLRFLIDVQLSILDQYHNRLQGSIEAYISMSSTVGRTLHGISKEDQAKLEGLGGLESLCKVYCSADHVISELHSQSNNVFFVELWAELQKRAKKRNADDTLAGPMSYQDVKESTSSAVGSEEDGAVFDETTEAYTRLRREAERLIGEDIRASLPKFFKSYFQKPAWLIVNAGSDDEDSVIEHITAELDEPLQALKSRLNILKKSVSTATLRRIWKTVSTHLQDLIWRDIILHSRFTLAGGRQFARDMRAINDMVDVFLPGASNSAIGMLKIQDASYLLSLPLTSKDGGLSISQAYVRATTDNASLRVLTEDLQSKELDFTEVRRVIERRVEGDEHM